MARHRGCRLVDLGYVEISAGACDGRVGIAWKAVPDRPSADAPPMERGVTSSGVSEWMSAEEAADRLGVKPATLYAYVSRGTLTRRKHEGRSVFNRAEIEELARRGRPRRQAGATELVIESAITMLGEDRHYYRGREAIALAATWRLEETALWLWTGAEPEAAADRDPAAQQAPGRRAEPGAVVAAGEAPARRAAPGVLAAAGEAPDWRAAPGVLAAAGEAPGRRAAPGALVAAGEAPGRRAAPGVLAAAGEAPARRAAPGGLAAAGEAPGRRAAPGGLAAAQEVPDWQAAPDALAAAREAQRGLSGDVLPLERLQVIVAALAAADPVRHNLDPAAVVQTGKGLMAGMVDALPGTDSGPTSRQPSRPNARQAQRKGRDAGLHTRLWRKLGAARAEEGLADVLRFALVLLADHELAASTLAARVAASVRADPYAVVTTGLGTVSGALHGGASLGVESLLAEIAEPERAAQAMGERLRRGERVAGFGHAVYRAGDARGDALMDRIRAAVPGYPRLAVAEAVLEEARRRALPAMNVDFPLGVLTHLAGMPRGAGEAIFGVARTAGWLAHAMEEYANPTRLRLRAAYTGPLV
ncbi:citrate/2-methylcitrate synthase [Dactylosporangium sp. CA-052675]|uniref:citrate/2-methylcitrate synthase n=1 Tax=Dactylosporangium sp. CA-052675 TaxID=3239927 RepID=UPI003D8EA45B